MKGDKSKPVSFSWLRAELCNIMGADNLGQVLSQAWGLRDSVNHLNRPAPRF